MTEVTWADRRPLVQSSPQTSRRLPTEVVNDKGRCLNDLRIEQLRQRRRGIVRIHDGLNRNQDD